MAKRKQKEDPRLTLFVVRAEVQALMDILVEGVERMDGREYVATEAQVWDAVVELNDVRTALATVLLKAHGVSQEAIDKAQGEAQWRWGGEVRVLNERTILCVELNAGRIQSWKA